MINTLLWVLKPCGYILAHSNVEVSCHFVDIQVSMNSAGSKMSGTVLATGKTQCGGNKMLKWLSSTYTKRSHTFWFITIYSTSPAEHRSSWGCRTFEAQQEELLLMQLWRERPGERAPLSDAPGCAKESCDREGDNRLGKQRLTWDETKLITMDKKDVLNRSKKWKTCQLWPVC